MEKKFRNNTLRIFQYLLKEFSAKTAESSLERLEKRIEFIARNPETGKASAKRKMFKAFYLPLTTKSFIAIVKGKLKYFAYLICAKTQRKDRIS